MRYSVTFPLIVILVTLLTAAVAVTGALYHGAHRAAEVDLLRARLALVLEDVQGVAESALGLGLPLDQLPGVDRAMQSHVQRDPEILSIEFFNEDGVVLYATDESLRGDLVSEGWMSAWESERARVLVRDEVDAHVVGARVRDSLGQLVGVLALRYSRVPIDRAVETLAWQLVWVCIGAAAVFMLIGGVLGMILTRTLRQRLHTVVGATEVSPEAGTPSSNEPSFAAQIAAAKEAIRAATAETRRVGGVGAPKRQPVVERAGD